MWNARNLQPPCPFEDLRGVDEAAPPPARRPHMVHTPYWDYGSMLHGVCVVSYMVYGPDLLRSRGPIGKSQEVQNRL